MTPFSVPETDVYWRKARVSLLNSGYLPCPPKVAGNLIRGYQRSSVVWILDKPTSIFVLQEDWLSEPRLPSPEEKPRRHN